MSSFSPQEMEQALRECAAEPIHQIGKIQPHGALLVLSADPQHRVLQGSDNLDSFFGVPVDQAIGKPLAWLMGKPASLQIDQLIRKLVSKNTITGKINIFQKQSSHELQVHLYTSDGLLVLEVEHNQATQTEGDLAQWMLGIQQTLLSTEKNADTSHYFDRIVELVRELTGYDSVMTYRFDSNWDGEVISQSRAEHSPSYLGLQFPSCDIPAQARRLYTQNLVRIVADIDATPVAILPNINPVSEQPLDMTFSALRSLSPIHMEYLRNIGVQASMVISLLQNGRLWGLITCHHKTAKRVSIAMRDTAVFISLMASAKLATMESLDRLNQVEKAHNILNDLANQIILGNVEAMQQQILPKLQSLLNATGMIMITDGKHHLLGDVPESTDIDHLLTWLDSQQEAEVFSCDCLEQQFFPASTYRSIVSGLLVASISSNMSNCIIWLRKEKLQTIHWAGNADKGQIRDTAGNLRLTPRKSFEIWTETWRGRSIPWTSVEISIALMMAEALPKSLEQKQRLEQEQAQRKSAEIAAMSMQQQVEVITSVVPGVVYQFLLTSAGEWSFTYVSKGIQNLYEVTPVEAYQDHNALISCIVIEDKDSHRESLEHSALALTVWDHEFRIKTLNGHVKWIHGLATPQRQEDGGILWSGLLTDVSENKKIEEMMRLRESGLDKAGEHLFWVDKEAHILDVNRLSCSKLGYSHAELCNLTIANIDPSFEMDKWPGHWRELKQNGSLRFQSFHKARDGKMFPVEVVYSYFEYDDKEYCCAFVRDISEYNPLEKELDTQAKIDFLTGLANRCHFLELAEQEVERCQRYGNSLSLLILDIDFFKAINDTYGHKTGNEVLQKLASVCKEVLRKIDVIGRLGGEEFAILLPETPGQCAPIVAERIRQALEKTSVPLEKSSLELQFTVSIGVTAMTTPQETVEDLLQKADAALFQAKKAERNQIFVSNDLVNL